MPRDVATWWNSTFDMLEFPINYRAAIDVIASNCDLNLRKYELEDDEWVIAANLRDTLKVCTILLFLNYYWIVVVSLQIFKHATLFFSCDTPNISTVIPAMDHINTHLVTATQNLTYSPSIHAALAIGKKTLNQYYNKTDSSEVYRIAMGMFFCLTTWYVVDYFSVLHPHHKLQYFKMAGWEDGWIKTACSIVHEEFDRTYAFMDVESGENQANAEVWQQLELLFLLTDYPNMISSQCLHHLPIYLTAYLL